VSNCPAHLLTNYQLDQLNLLTIADGCMSALTSWARRASMTQPNEKASGDAGQAFVRHERMALQP
jgi:hypothetical protein